MFLLTTEYPVFPSFIKDFFILNRIPTKNSEINFNFLDFPSILSFPFLYSFTNFSGPPLSFTPLTFTLYHPFPPQAKIILMHDRKCYFIKKKYFEYE